jgi:heavy metal sensor kinase
LTLAFAGALALVICGLVLLIYVRFSAELDKAINGGLRDRASTLSTLAQARDSARAGAELRTELAAHGEGFAQVIDGSDRVLLDAAPGHHALLGRAEVAKALGGPLRADHPPAAGEQARVRVYAVPVDVGARRYVAVVGTTLRDREHAIGGLVTMLLIAAPIALVLLVLAGYGVVTGALAPVERMRRRAAAISAEAPGQRLPVPEGDDELARLGRTLNEMLGRLEDALIREREFSANASHELRTPLAMLRTEVELALDRPRTPAEMHAAMVSISEETERLVALAEDLLALSRADRGSLPIQVGRTDAASLLRSVRRRFDARVAGQGRAITVQAEEPAPIEADPARIEQALANLVENALRHGAGTIELRVRRDTDAVELHVLDDGQGFPEQFIDKAFERFSRAKEARARAGSGLGLAIVQAIAEAHGGHGEAHNRPDGGADVSITLPLIRTPERQPEPAGR